MKAKLTILSLFCALTCFGQQVVGILVGPQPLISAIGIGITNPIAPVEIVTKQDKPALMFTESSSGYLWSYISTHFDGSGPYNPANNYVQTWVANGPWYSSSLAVDARGDGSLRVPNFIAPTNGVVLQGDGCTYTLKVVGKQLVAVYSDRYGQTTNVLASPPQVAVPNVQTQSYSLAALSNAFWVSMPATLDDVSKLDWSAFGIVTNINGYWGTVPLLTPRHVYSVAHVLWPDQYVGMKVYFGNNIRTITNVVQNQVLDLAIGVLDADLPIAPFRILPPSVTWSNVFAAWSNNVPMLWNRHVSNAWYGVKLMGIYGGDTLCFVPTLTNCSYAATTWGSVGDSASPLFFPLNSNPVLAYCLTSTGAGRFLSATNAFNWLSNQVAPYQLSTVNVQ